MKWTDKRLLEFFYEIWPNLDKLIEEYNRKAFEEKRLTNLNDREEGIKVDISEEKLNHIKELFEKDESEDSTVNWDKLSKELWDPTNKTLTFDYDQIELKHPMPEIPDVPQADPNTQRNEITINQNNETPEEFRCKNGNSGKENRDWRSRSMVISHNCGPQERRNTPKSCGLQPFK